MKTITHSNGHIYNVLKVAENGDFENAMLLEDTNENAYTKYIVCMGWNDNYKSWNYSNYFTNYFDADKEFKNKVNLYIF